MVVTSALLLFGFWEMERVKWTLGFSGGSVVKNPPSEREPRVQSLGWENCIEKGKATHPVFWLGECHGLYSPWGRKELDTTD